MTDDVWSLAITQPLREGAVAEYLTRHDYAFHWFRERTTITRNGRLVNALRSLFPQYIFLQARQQWPLIREQTKVAGFVNFGGQLASIGERVVRDLMLVCPNDIAPQREIPCRFRRGDRVDIIGAGPLSGHTATFLRSITAERSVVWMDIFGRSVPVTVETDSLLHYVPGPPQKRWRPHRPRFRHNRAYYEARAERVSPLVG